MKAVVIISAGFKEIGPEGAELERQILATARANGMRIVGPELPGRHAPADRPQRHLRGRHLRPRHRRLRQPERRAPHRGPRLEHAREGRLQRGRLARARCSTWAGATSSRTSATTRRPRASSSTWRRSATPGPSSRPPARWPSRKPIIVIKPGRTAQAAKAAASHTGSLTGSDEVLAAAFRRVGVLRVDAISDLFDVAEVLAKQPRPSGKRLTIVTNAGGPGVLATDALITGGGEVTEISPATMEELNGFLPGPWSHNNPIDIIGDAAPGALREGPRGRRPRRGQRRPPRDPHARRR